MNDEITPEILERNGWIFRGGLWVLKSTVRLGWYPDKKELIVGYWAFPARIEYIHQLRQIMALCNIKDEIRL